MKKYFFLFILLAIISCGKVFHEEEDDYIVINNRQEAIDMLNGIYANLVKVYDNYYFKALGRSDDINIYYKLNFVVPGTSESCRGDRTYDLTPPYDNIYLRFYKIIISANSVIPQISEKNEPELLGELYMLRAYTYFTLARFFGNPYLVKDIDVNYLLERPGYTEVYEFIESDILNALRLLPDTYSKARIPGETPHKGTAKALMAEIYLNWAGYPVNDKSKYIKAAQFAGEVIQKRDYYGFGLLDDFADLWKVKNKHNKENVFGLFYNLNNTETQNLINYMSIVRMDNAIPLHLESDYKPEFKFFNSMPANYRKSTSYITGGVTIDWSQVNPRYKSIVLDPLVNPCNYIYNVVSMKWVDTTNLKSENGSDGNFGLVASEMTLYLLRYAQTLLTFSEARARSGILDDSTYEAVNMIRRRANHLDPGTPSQFDLQKGLTSEQFLDSLVWERGWELCAEPNGRWFDIVRLDLKDKLTEYRYNIDIPYEVPAEFLQDNWYFYALP
jgi:hypothetical protein